MLFVSLGGCGDAAEATTSAASGSAGTDTDSNAEASTFAETGAGSSTALGSASESGGSGDATTSDDTTGISDSDTDGTGTPPPGECGNGVLDPGELCDPGTVDARNVCDRSCSAESGTLLWDVEVGRPGAAVLFRDVAVNAMGEVYVAGDFGGQNAGVQKFGADGEELWSASAFIDADESNAHRVAVMPDDGVVIAGRTLSVAGGVSTFGVAARFSADGTPAWEQEFDSDLFELSGWTGLDTDEQGRIVMCGMAGSEADGWYPRVRTADADGSGAWSWDGEVLPAAASAAGCLWGAQGGVIVANVYGDIFRLDDSGVQVASWPSDGILDVYGLDDDPEGNVFVAGRSGPPFGWETRRLSSEGLPVWSEVFPAEFGDSPSDIRVFGEGLTIVGTVTEAGAGLGRIAYHSPDDGAMLWEASIQDEDCSSVDVDQESGAVYVVCSSTYFDGDTSRLRKYAP